MSGLNFWYGWAMFQVTMAAHVEQAGRPVHLVRELELPFAPYVGLTIHLSGEMMFEVQDAFWHHGRGRFFVVCDTDPDGNVAFTDVRMFEEMGFQLVKTLL